MQQQQPGIVTHSRISSLLISGHLTKTRVASSYSVRTATVTGSGRGSREFLSDAPFFGLSLWTEFKQANCACVSGWSCLMNLDLRSKFWLFLSYLGSFVGVSSCWPCSE